MASDVAANRFSKPHALIADDSRIVRATLSKHLSGLFNFSEALDGEEAWEFLLRNESVDLLITDLTMPRLDGYGLLRRMRASRSEHLREMPVVVVSGSDDADERRQAKEAGATDLITKGMPTGQLVSRMTLLAQLVYAQRRHAGRDVGAPDLSPYAFQSGAERLLAHALRHEQALALLSLTVAGDAALSDRMLAGLQRAIRQTDLLACTGAAEFTIATASLDAAAARAFADRLCDAANAVLAGQKGAGVAVSQCCGVATLGESGASAATAPTLHALWDAARRRSHAGQMLGCVGVIGAAEESAFANQ
jgi:two-component system cell cycle response regulator